MINREINPQVWFGERELHHVPPHFVKATTPLTTESMSWVNTRLISRYALSSLWETDNFIFDSGSYVYFEDPSEAMLYELRWSGTK
jgi:hypothetical protein